jgi:hypothetical protein
MTSTKREAIGCFFLILKAGVEESIVNILYRLRITDHGSRGRLNLTTRVVRSQSSSTPTTSEI